MSVHYDGFMPPGFGNAGFDNLTLVSDPERLVRSSCRQIPESRRVRKEYVSIELTFSSNAMTML